jgi:hypothetical protein
MEKAMRLRLLVPDRPAVRRGGVAIVLVTLVALAFTASYVGALHRPVPHDVPVAVAGPPALAAQIDRSPAFRAVRSASAADALARIDDRDAYGAVVAGPGTTRLVVAPAASATVARILRARLQPVLARATGGPVAVGVRHPLPAQDPQGLTAFYVAIGWAVCGYLGATFLGLQFGMGIGRRRVLWRLEGLAVLGVFTGAGGAAIAQGISDVGGSFADIALFGALTVLAIGMTTVALQRLLGLVGTGVAILVFVVLGNPSSGGALAPELLPGLFRAIGPLIPTGAAVQAVRNIGYFSGHALGGPLLCAGIWLAAGTAAAFAATFAPPPRVDEAEASLAATAAP